MATTTAPVKISFGEPFHPKMILEGTKDTTIRLSIRDLKEGDIIVLCDSEGKEFGKAKIVSVKITTLGNLTEADMQGHEKYPSSEEMYRVFQGYYKAINVGPDSQTQVIKFKLIKS